MKPCPMTAKASEADQQRRWRPKYVYLENVGSCDAGLSDLFEKALDTRNPCEPVRNRPNLGSLLDEPVRKSSDAARHSTKPESQLSRGGTPQLQIMLVASPRNSHFLNDSKQIVCRRSLTGTRFEPAP